MRVDNILHRGKDIKTGRRVYGYFSKVKWYLDDKDMYIIIPEGCHAYPANEIFYHVVDPDTVGQYVMRDDIDGNKLYTDDLIECYWYYTAVPEHFTRLACVVSDSCLDVGCGCWWPNGTQTYKLVGNKHDNPELYQQMVEAAREERRKRCARHEED